FSVTILILIEIHSIRLQSGIRKIRTINPAT
ncbi:unnamed protein product, partial [marine sediment metagenome]